MEPDDEIYANGGADVSNNRNRPIISSEQLDIEAYAGLYTGRTKITRLLFIADRFGQNNNTAMKMEALRMAYEEIKKGENTQLFRDVVHKIDGRLGDNYGMDSAWCEMVDRRADQRKEKLENELNAYRTNLIKESIRMGYNDFGDYYYAHGYLADAFKSYARTRDYCTTSKHVIHTCMSAILVSIEMGQFTHVTSYVSKAEQTAEALEPPTVSKLRCAAGLAHLEAKKYKLAARKFLEVSPELGNSYNEVIAPQDVATYGGLCALASFDRMELKSKVIDNPNFRNFLELVPEVRELIHDFYSSHCALYCKSKKFCVGTWYIDGRRFRIFYFNKVLDFILRRWFFNAGKIAYTCSIFPRACHQ
ncbi:PREDICTED: COP9 signalosome complex subunit 1-like isoform X2 [Populus euphratica]|uniref:COP9 signalosome complex subunit 1-like isoform X2 n=1 Tax=Populus euphratica TaxID=75702 RepID=A0AAJ6XY55_POPEU|nr:PREDICTED: COP9 signalosome complex subunit 1-like isoform X2 [Populus euphratica]